MTDIKISVIIPVYNAQNYIRRSLDSLCKQTLKEIQVILINDESTDESLKICEEYVNIDKRFAVYSKKNEGAGLARNTGLQYAKGEYIAFLDADDYITSDMYEVLYSKALRNHADACMCGYYKIGSHGEVLKEFIPESDQTFKGKEAVISKVLLNVLGADPYHHTDVILGTSVWKTIFKRSVIMENQIKFYSEREVTSEDTLFNINFFMKASSVVLVAKPLYMYCVNTESLSRKFREESFYDIKRLYLLEKEHLESILQKKEAMERIERSFLGNTRTILAQAVLCNKYKGALKYIDKVCKDQELITVLSRYPYRCNPRKIWIFNALLKSQKKILLWVFLKIYLLKGNLH